jgi:hypothetical protein
MSEIEELSFSRRNFLRAARGFRGLWRAFRGPREPGPGAGGQRRRRKLGGCRAQSSHGEMKRPGVWTPHGSAHPCFEKRLPGRGALGWREDRKGVRVLGNWASGIQ